MKKCEQLCFFEEIERRGRYVIIWVNGKVNQVQVLFFEEGDCEVINCFCYCFKGYYLKICLKILVIMFNDEKIVYFVCYC